MSMNIKSDEAHRLAAELARVRGVTVTRAVTDALRNEIERERGRERRAGLAGELVRIGRRCAAHIHGSVTSADHDSLLYDERGLPR